MSVIESSSDSTVSAIPSPVITNNLSTVSPFRSAESFYSYCIKVQSKLSEHAQKRIDFVQTAFDRLTRLLQAAKDVEDTGLYNEIWHHRVTAKELLDSLKINARSDAPSNANLRPSLLPQEIALGNGHGIQGASSPNESHATVLSGNHPSSIQPPNLMSVPPQPYTPFSQSNQVGNGYDAGYGNGNYGGAMDSGPRIPRRLRPLTDIEADAVSLREEVRKFAESHPLSTRLGDLSIPNCFI